MSMRCSLALMGAALLGVCVGACGSAGKTAGASETRGGSTETAPNPQHVLVYDQDDNSIWGYGHEASPGEARTITAVVRRYFATAAAGDGGTACTMILPSMAKAMPEDYGRPPGPPALRGNTCAVILSKLFVEERRRLSSDIATIAVIGVRVNGSVAYALLGFGKNPEPRYIALRREAGVWKLEDLLDDPYT